MKFYKGMRRDTAHVDQPQDSYRRARNIILDHTTFSVRTEGSIELLTSADPSNYFIGDATDRTLCGLIDLPQDRQLAIFHNATAGQREVYLIENEIYTQIIVSTDSEYEWVKEYPIKGAAYENSRNEVIAVWTDGVRPPVYSNISVASPAIYKLFPEANFPNARSLNVAQNTGGEIENGTYSFFIAYEVDKDNLTTFSPSYGTFHVGHGISNKTVNTTVGLQFDQLDTNYAFYRIYAIRNRNETLDTFYVGRQPTNQPTFLWTGQTLVGNIAVDQLTVPKGWYSTVESLTVLDDRLYAANVARSDQFDGQAIADNIDLVWSIDGSNKSIGNPYIDETKRKKWGPAYNNFNASFLDNEIIPANRDHYGMSKGFMPGCSYAFYIAFLLKDGSWTQGYFISAGSVAADADTVTPVSGYPTLGSDEYHGNLGSKSNNNGSFIHVMPEPALIHDVITTQDISAQFVGTSRDTTEMWAMMDIGVSAKSSDNLALIPTEVQSLIQGYSLFYAKPNGNTRDVLGYVPYIEGRGYVEQTSTIDGDESSRYLAIHDPYLLNQKPELNNFNYTVVYDGRASDPWTLPSTNNTNNTSNFEYLPGNSFGLLFNNNNRENRLCVDVGVLDDYNVGYFSEVKGSGNEGSQLKFGSDAPDNFDDYLDDHSEYVYLKIHKATPNDFYTEVDKQELCACSYIEKALTGTSMNRVSWGGDAVAHPVRNRYIELSNNGAGTTYVGQENHGPAATTVLKDLNVEINSYFTWTYALQGYEDLTDPTVLTEQQILLYETDSTLSYAGAPELVNPHAIPTHTYAKNVLKSAFTSDLDDPVYTFPNRVIRSAKQNYESDAIQWRNFAIADLTDNALNKGPIKNIEAYAGELIIHHTDGIFKTVGKETLDTSSAAVFVGSGDLFRSPPQELIPTEEGYAGITKHTDTKLTKGGYIFVDALAGKVFKLDSNLADISQKGMKTYFRESFRINVNNATSPFAGNGYSIGYDPVFDRIIITCITGLAADGQTIDEFQTISFSLLSDCWASNHTYPISAFATNRVSLIGFTGARFTTINVNNNVAGAYIEPVFNDGGSIVKSFQSFQWMTRVGEGEGDWSAETFDKVIVYNDRGCSGERTVTDNARWVEESWNFNDFRNLILDANAGNAFFDVDENLIADFTTAKPWYQQQRIRGAYAAIRLIISPNRNITLYLNEAIAKFRASYR